MLKNIKIGMRLTLGFGILIIIAVLVSSIAINRLSVINSMNDMLFQHTLEVRAAAFEANANIISVHRAMKDVALSTTPEQLNTAVDEVNKYDAGVLKHFEVIRSKFLTDKKIVDDALKSYQDWKVMRDETIELTRSGHLAEAAENTRTKGAKQVQLITENMHKLLESAGTRAHNSHNDTKMAANQAQETLIIALVVLVVLGALLAFVITKSIATPLTKLSKLVKEAANGDLTAIYTGAKYSKDEIGILLNSYNAMLENIKNLTFQVNENANTVAASAQQLMAASETTSTAATEIAGSIQQISAGTENQNISIEDIAKTISELATGTEQTAQNMQNIAAEVQNVNILSENGKMDLASVIEQMNIISATSKDSVIKVNNLADKSKDIESIIEVIADISGQTNLLALNAAIEAARAGEQGRGFAVVSEEIRKLAEQSASSTSSIAEIIKQIQHEVREVIKAIEKDDKNAEDGLKKVEKANSSFDDIMSGFNKITDKVEDVSAVMEQMSAGTEQTLTSIKAIVDTSRETTANVEEVTASVEEQTSTMEEITASAATLAQMSENLQDAVAKFKL